MINSGANMTRCKGRSGSEMRLISKFAALWPMTRFFRLLPWLIVHRLGVPLECRHNPPRRYLPIFSPIL